MNLPLLSGGTRMCLNGPRSIAALSKQMVAGTLPRKDAEVVHICWNLVFDPGPRGHSVWPVISLCHVFTNTGSIGTQKKSTQRPDTSGRRETCHLTERPLFVPHRSPGNHSFKWAAHELPCHPLIGWESTNGNVFLMAPTQREQSEKA